MRSMTAILALGAMLAALPAAPALAASAAQARDMCKARLQSQFSASGSNVVASEDGDDRWMVTGNASRSGEQGHFSCWVDNGRISNVETSDWKKKTGDDAAVAVGAIALAAIIAAATSKRRSHEKDRYNDDGWGQNSYYDDSFSVARDVTCYRNQRACYNDWNHSYNMRWTQREFGY
jgi:hypothetical protein